MSYRCRLLSVLVGLGAFPFGLAESAARDGFGYERGEFRLTEITVRREAAELQIETKRIEGQWPAVERPVRAIPVDAHEVRRH